MWERLSGSFCCEHNVCIMFFQKTLKKAVELDIVIKE